MIIGVAEQKMSQVNGSCSEGTGGGGEKERAFREDVCQNPLKTSGRLSQKRFVVGCCRWLRSTQLSRVFFTCSTDQIKVLQHFILDNWAGKREKKLFGLCLTTLELNRNVSSALMVILDEKERIRNKLLVKMKLQINSTCDNRIVVNIELT